MEITEQWLTRDDEARLFLRRWIPQARPRAFIQIVHGMAEHAGRYGRLAESLCEAGIETWAADQRGHGKTADLSINGPGKGGILGHVADKNSVFTAAGDVDAVFDAVEQLHGKGAPMFLLGHSWGSFVSQAYIETRGERLSGCVLSGTRGPGGFKISSGARVVQLISGLKGCRKPSKLVRALADGAYNKPFRPNRTLFDWLSRDENEVDAYINDPACGNICSSGFYRDMLLGFLAIHSEKAIGKIPRKLPVYIFSGSADPVGDMGASPTALVDAYKEHGVDGLEFVLYPDARHETLNETNREEVIANLLAWLEKHL